MSKRRRKQSNVKTLAWVSLGIVSVSTNIYYDIRKVSVGEHILSWEVTTASGQKLKVDKAITIQDNKFGGAE